MTVEEGRSSFTTDVPVPERFSGALAAQDDVLIEMPMPPRPKRIIRQQIPGDILNNTALKDAISVLPENYNFEIMKTLWRMREAGAKRIALQMPEGLLMYACVISDILQEFGAATDTFILGDVTYGACCVDDFTAAAMGADFLVHYGHSCLVPVTTTKISCMYVFVDIQIDLKHFVESMELNFKPNERIAVAGTIQFATSLQAAKEQLEEKGYSNLHIPQERPLSAGETLGCTAPTLPTEVEKIVFVADGRFHLEALMIANPSLPAYRYDPYGRNLTVEEYDQEDMRAVRRRAIERAQSAQRWGLVMGTLGRQGNPALVDKLEALLESSKLEYSVVLMSEVTPESLKLMPDIEAWIQVACPRLSIDWGEGFEKPTLTPYEAMVCLGAAPRWWDSEPDANGTCTYPMDYYARDGGEWNSSYHKARPGRKRGTSRAQAGSCDCK